MTAVGIILLIIMAALGSFMHYIGFYAMSNAFAAYGGEAITWFILGSIVLLCGVVLIALAGALLLMWIKAGDW